MFDLATLGEIYDKHKDDYNARVEEFSIGHRQFAFNSQTAILGVVNLSTDSWYKHSICYTPEQAVRRGQVLTAQGADILDLGTESTAKSAKRVDEEQQKSQLQPLIKNFSEQGILTSIDTYYTDVAESCLKAGANVINFTGTENSEKMYQLVAEYDAAIVICYIQGKHARDVNEFNFVSDKDPMDVLYDYFAKEIDIATGYGVRKIFIDPGFGLGYSNFYYQYEHAPQRIRYQFETLLNAFRLRKLGFPVFNVIPTSLEIFGDEFRSSQVLSAVFAGLGKSDLLRTHEVAKVKGVLDTLSVI